jgi:hypothetical protein
VAVRFESSDRGGRAGIAGEKCRSVQNGSPSACPPASRADFDTLVWSWAIAVVELFKSLAHNLSMESNAIRTSIDLPRDLHRRVHEAAARKGCSARKLILAGIERAVEETKMSRPIRGSVSISR